MTIRYVLLEGPVVLREGKVEALGAVDSWAQLGGGVSLGAGADFEEGGA